MKKISFVIAMALLLLNAGCVREPADVLPPDTFVRIDAYVEDLVKLNEVPGLALAVIHKGVVVHQNYYGVTNLATGKPVTSETVFRIYSLSKIITAVAIFDLIEQGKLNLDDQLSTHFEGLPESWNDVTISHLLAHASGLPDIRNLVSELADEALTDEDFFKFIYSEERQFQTGDDWSYTQTNYLFLERILENVTGEKFEDYIRARQFSVVDKARTIYSSSDFDTIVNRASNYKYNTDTGQHDQKQENYGTRNNVLAGLNLTLDELVVWNDYLDDGRFISENTKSRMWTRFPFNKSDEQFLHGWGVYPVADQVSYGFTGGGVSGLRKFPNHDLTIIVLTNGYKYFSVHNTVINHVAGFIDPALENKPVALARMYQHEYLENKFLDIESLFNKTVREHPELDAEEVMTSFAYKLSDIREKDQSLEVFREIVKRIPASVKANNELGYAYLSNGDENAALLTFERSLALDPEDAGALKMIQGFRQRLE